LQDQSRAPEPVRPSRPDHEYRGVGLLNQERSAGNGLRPLHCARRYAVELHPPASGAAHPADLPVNLARPTASSSARANDGQSELIRLVDIQNEMRIDGRRLGGLEARLSLGWYTSRSGTGITAKDFEQVSEGSAHQSVISTGRSSLSQSFAAVAAEPSPDPS
jgi:hypothetical protein